LSVFLTYIGPCGTHGGGERCSQGVGWKAWREDLGMNGRITLRWALGRWIDEADWIQLAQDKFQWHAFVSMVMNFWVP
jgi:hypothetical protein